MRTEAQKIKHREYQRNFEKANPDYKKRWRAANLERCRQVDRLQSKRYRDKCPDKIRAWKKADRERRKEQIAAAKRVYYLANADKIRLKVKLWRQNNRDRKRSLHRAYKKRHPEKVTEHAMRRRCRMLSTEPEDCTNKIKLLRRERFCHWCTTPITTSNLEIDHVIPVSRGGRHIPDNLVAACSTCNQSKGNRLLSEWTWKEAA